MIAEEIALVVPAVDANVVLTIERAGMDVGPYRPLCRTMPLALEAHYEAYNLTICHVSAPQFFSAVSSAGRRDAGLA
jgi:hypothetical protein